jgi:penicillin-binding protein 1A
VSTEPQKPLSPSTTPTGEAPPPRAARTSTGSAKASKRRARTAWRVVRFGLLASALAGAASLVVLATYVRKLEANLPSVEALKHGYQMPQVTRVLAADKSVLAEIVTERRTVVDVQLLPPHVKTAVLAAEDANFYEHKGLNYLGIARALIVNFRHRGARQGGSTITQQVVKNIFLSPEKTVERKVREMLLARRIEQELTKDEILGLYMNHIYFGSGRYGVEEAARGYFGKHANELSIAEAALIAGMPKNPSGYNPRTHMEAAVGRRKFVLEQMRDKGFIKPAEFDAALVEPVKLAPVVEANEELAPEVVELARKMIREVAGEEAARRGGFTVETTIDPRLQAAARTAIRESTSAYDKRWKLVGPFAAYPADGRDPKTKKKLPAQEAAYVGTPRFGHGETYVGVVVGHDDAQRTVDVQVGSVLGVVKLETKDRYDPTDAPPSTWAPIGTRLRVSLQAPPPTTPATAASGSASTSVTSVTSATSAGSTGSTTTSPTAADAKVPLRLELGPEAALVAIDVRTHRVVAMVGNVEGAVGGLDRARNAHRQPGSTFKPFVYGAAIAAKKITPATLIEATPGDFGGWNPKNYERWTNPDPMRVREALANSVNLVAVRVAQDVGPQQVIDFARKAGIASPLKPDLALALGSYEVTPLELATAYSTLASGGVFEAPLIISRIIGPDGRELALPNHAPAARVFGEAETYVLTDVMTSVVQQGTAAAARSLGRPIAGKTGTSNAAKDTWFAGFSADLVAVTWVGFDDGRPLGYGEAGAKTALPGWISFMKEATKGKPPVDFPRPAGVVTVTIDPKTGKLPYPNEEKTIDEVFLAGTEPTEAAPTPEDKTEKPAPGDAPEDPWAKSASNP